MRPYVELVKAQVKVLWGGLKVGRGTQPVLYYRWHAYLATL